MSYLGNQQQKGGIFNQPIQQQQFNQPVGGLGIGQAQTLGMGQAQPMGLGMGQTQPMGMGQAQPMGMGQAQPMGMGGIVPMGMGQAQTLGMGQAQPLGMGGVQPLNVGMATQPQPSIFGNQQSILNPQNPFFQNQTPNIMQQQNAINFQSALQQGPITATIKNIPQMIDNLKEKRNIIKKTFDELATPQSRQQLGNFDLTKLMNIETQKLLEGTKVLVIQQHDLVRRLEEFITALGIIENLSNDGLSAIRQNNTPPNQLIQRNLNTDYKELQGAESILTSTLQRLDVNGDNRYFYGYSQTDMNQFQVPQNYEYNFIVNLNKQVESIGEAISKLQEFNEAHAITVEDLDEQDFDEVVDNYLQRKLQRIANLSHLLFSLQQKIRYIHQKIENFRTKHFAILYPDRNRKLNEYHSIDLSKDQLQTIISKELNI